MLNIIDMRLEKFFGDPDEKRVAKDTAGSVAGDDLNLKEILKKSGGFGMIFGAALVAYALDLDKYIRTAFAGKVIFKGVGAAFKAVFGAKFIADFLKNLTPVKNFMAGFKNVGKSIGAIKAPLAIKDFTTVFGKIGATIKTVGNFFKPLLNVFKFLGQLSGITSAVGKVGGLFAKVMPILKGVASKLLLPLFAIFDFVTGFIKGFASQGEGDTRTTMERLLDGLAGGFIKMIKGIFIVPLDLLKDGVSFLAEKLGFENFSAALDSFSFNDIFDKFLKFASNIFSSEPEDGYFSIVQWVSNAIDTGMTNAKNNLAAVGDVFGTVFKFATNLFSAEPEEGYFSIVAWAMEKAENIKKTISGLFGGGDDAGGGGGFSISDLFGGLDFEFPSVENILGTVGEKINAAFQSIAEGIAKSSFVPNSIGGFFSDAGVSLAGFMGAKNIEKYNVDTKQMDTLKQAAPRTASEGTAAGEMSKEVAAKKEAPSGPAVVDASTKSGDNVTNNNSKTEMAAGKVESRPSSNPAAGRRRRGRGGR